MDVTDNLGDVFQFTYSLGNGNNFLTITAGNGESIVSTALSYTLSTGFTDLRQVRISGAQGNAVPEPGTLALLGTGVVVLFAVRRRRV